MFTQSDYFDSYAETFGRQEASDIFAYHQARKNAARFKFKLCRFAKSRETFRSPELRKPYKALYTGRAVFTISSRGFDKSAAT